jgi:hypothetical protein
VCRWPMHGPQSPLMRTAIRQCNSGYLQTAVIRNMINFAEVCGEVPTMRRSGMFLSR